MISPKHKRSKSLGDSIKVSPRRRRLRYFSGHNLGFCPCEKVCELSRNYVNALSRMKKLTTCFLFPEICRQESQAQRVWSLYTSSRRSAKQCHPDTRYTHSIYSFFCCWPGKIGSQSISEYHHCVMDINLVYATVIYRIQKQVIWEYEQLWVVLFAGISKTCIRYFICD